MTNSNGLFGSGVGLSDILATLQNGVRNLAELTKAISVGNLNQTGTSVNATAGTAGAPPAQVAGYLTTVVNGTTVKIPFYN